MRQAIWRMGHTHTNTTEESARTHLDGHRMNGRADLEASFLELHHRGVVDTGALWEDQERPGLRAHHVLLQPPQRQRTVEHFVPIEPNARDRGAHNRFHQTEETWLQLADLS